MGDFDRHDNVSMGAIITTLEMMDKKLDKIENGLYDKDGVLERVTVVETKSGSTQIELTEHKNSHWQWAGIVIAGAGVFVAIVAIVIEKLIK